MNNINSFDLKNILRHCLETGGRDKRYELLYKAYGEIIEEYSTAQASLIITNDLGVVVNVRIIRRTKQLFVKSKNKLKLMEEKIEIQKESKTKIIDMFEPISIDEIVARGSNITFKKNI